MRAEISRNALPDKTGDYFPPAARDLFHEAAILAFLSDDWYGCLITEGEHAFFNSFARNAIPGTNFYDIDPFMGYAGPLSTTEDPAFLESTLALYREKCRDLKIVAELIRFNPLLQQEARFLAQKPVKKIAGKDIVIVPCTASEEEQLKLVTPPCHRRIKAGKRNFIFRILRPDELPAFCTLYRNAMIRAEANSCWHFSDAQLEKLAKSPDTAIYGVFSGNELQSATLVSHHAVTSHYVLAANSEAYAKGAGEFLVFGAIRAAAEKGNRRIILGGGVTADKDDALLRFKKKFAPELTSFILAGMVHDEAVYTELVENAKSRQPELAAIPYFLKYRLLKDST